MRLFFPLAACALLAACSDAPIASPKKEFAKPLAPVTGRMAFQSTYASARGWSPDAQPLRVRSMNLPGSKPSEGKASLWEVTYVAPSKSAARVYTWSAAEDDTLHQGVYPGPQQSYGGSGQERAFIPAALKTDTDEAIKIATEESEAYLAKPGKKPDVTYLLEFTPRFPNPVWRVLWGNSVGTAERQVFVDASTGVVVGKE